MKRVFAVPFRSRTGQTASVAAAVLAAVFSVGGSVVPAQADPFVATLPVSASGPTTVLEGTPAAYTFAVTNNTSQSLSVDFALAYVQYVSGDITDNIEFRSGAPGVPFVFPAASVQFFSYNIPSGGVPDGTNDFGVYNLNFFVELSDLPTFGVPQDNFTPQGNLLLGSQTANSDQTVFQSITACLSPTQRLCGVPGFLYPPSRNPGFDILGGEASLTVTITDVPEPSSIASVSTAGLGLWFAWRNRRRACYKLCE